VRKLGRKSRRALFAVGGFMLLIALAFAITPYFAPPDRVEPGTDALAEGVPSLPLPDGVEETFEPHISIDPNDPDHIVVAGMYGNRFARAGEFIRLWRSTDGGESWTDKTVPAVKYSGLFAADPVTAFDSRGNTLVTQMYSGTALNNVHPLIAWAGTTLPIWWSDLQAASDANARRFRAGEEEEGAGLGMFIEASPAVDPKPSDPSPIDVVSGNTAAVDKEWMTVDNHEASPYRDSIYVVTPYKPASKGAERREDMEIRITVSRDGGRSFSEPKQLAQAGYAPQVVVAPNGDVEVLYQPAFSSDSIVAMTSTDGGESFSEPTLVSPPERGTRKDIASLSVDPQGAYLACWNQGYYSDRSLRVFCSRSSDGLKWDSPTDIAPQVSRDVRFSLPALASSDSGDYIMAYQSDDNETSSVLYRSVDGGKTFTTAEILGTRPFGKDQFCSGVATDVVCRYDFFSHSFVAGDYVSLSAVGGRVAAAFVLPRGSEPAGFANVYARVLNFK
jgi:hypothetical protein